MTNNRNVVATVLHDELTSILSLLKDTDPRVNQVLERVSQIDEEIRKVHVIKLEHRKNEATYVDRSLFFAIGISHCKRCDDWTSQQDILRRERTTLYAELRKLSYGIDPARIVQAEKESSKK
jgi:hypothetical protein